MMPAPFFGPRKQTFDLIVYGLLDSAHPPQPGTLVEDVGFIDKTAFYADPSLHASVSTDDWPFFYMPQRIYPLSYLIMIIQVLILSLLVGVNFFSESPKFSNLPFFFLGAGFMLIETKEITEMGLTFGNT
jgi:hypothetical protein